MSMETFLPAGFQFAWAFTAGRRCANQIPSLVAWIISGLWSFEPLVSAGTWQVGRSREALPSFAKSTPKIFETGPDREYSEFQPTQAIEVIWPMQIAVVPAGEIKLMGR
jgi:hypothetical protein